MEFKPDNITYDYIICNNGAVIFNKDMKKIYEQVITTDISNKIIAYLKTKENIEMFFYDNEDNVEYHNQELLKLRIKTLDYELAQTIEDEVNNFFKDDVKAHSTFPGMYYDNFDLEIVDIVSKSAGKENAIKKLLDILNIEKEQVVNISD